MTTNQRYSSIIAGLAVSVWAAVAAGQPVEAGVNATPTVMILFDSSGSMEWRDDGADDSYPTCVADGFGPTALGEGVSRMHSAIQVLTGEIPDQYCSTELRDQDVNRIDQVDPSRPQGIRHSRLCSLNGGATNAAVDCMPTTASGPSASLNQLDNGLIDAFGSVISFGFMSFDSFEEPGDCADGMFSYGPSQSMASQASDPLVPLPTSIGACTGSGVGSTCWNLGARRPSDPGLSPACAGDVEQGLTIAPLDPSNTLSPAQIRAQVEEQITRTVPYWSTPLGAMLADALVMYTETGTDRFYSGRDADGADYSRGYSDPYQACRNRYVLLLTDGIPSFDACVRTGTATSIEPWDPGCENYPYADAEFYADQLASAGIPVYVVGFNIPDAAARARLDAIAVAGGTDDARFAGSGLSLIFELGDILSQIASGTPSRTPPANTSRLSNGREGEFQFVANFSIDSGSPYWTGDLRRVGRQCSGGTLGSVVESSVLSSSSTGAGLDGASTAELDAASFFTAMPHIHSCSLASSGSARASLFGSSIASSINVTDPEIAAACQVGAFPGSSANVATACTVLQDGAVGLGEVVPASTGQAASCLVSLDASDANLAPILAAADGSTAGMFVNWLRGYSLSELRAAGFQAQIDALLPTAEFRWDSSVGEYSNDRQHRLGAVVHSAPTVLGVPDDSLQITDGYQAFVTDVEGRDSHVFMGTTDGLMHAFNARTLDRTWSFLPPSLAHRVGETMQSQVTLLDGPPVVDDVRMFRAGGVDERWASVLLFGYRTGGRGYTAMDVTDPTQPKFLWELDAELDPQLGQTYGRPGVGTVFLGAGCPGGAASCERGVAVLGGGLAPDGFASTSNIGKVVYVVDLETGEVIRRFTEMFDSSGSSVTLPASIAGDISMFDSFAGGIVTRSFFGDSEGRLYRLDLSSPDPSDWRIDLFFDSTTVTSDGGAILFEPTIALRRSDSRAVVVFGTGNLDDLDTVDGRQNFVASVVERPSFAGDGTFERMGGELLWALRLQPNERVTARPRVFNRRASFATFVPDADLCVIGGARVYQLDFIGDVDNVSPPFIADINASGWLSYLAQDPLLPLDSATNPPVAFHDDSFGYFPPQSIIYSLEFVETLSCFTESDLDAPRGSTGSVDSIVADQEGGETVLRLGVSTSIQGASGAGTTAAESSIVELDQGRVPYSIYPTSWSVILE